MTVLPANESEEAGVWKSRGEILTAYPLPMIVLSDNTYSPLAWAIRHAQRRLHREGYYQHAMVYFGGLGQLASQEWVLRRRRIGEFMTGSHRLKIWYNPQWTRQDRVHAAHKVKGMLAAPWYRRLYDPIGIVGQWLGCPEIQVPWMRFCSEMTGEVLRVLEPSFDLKHPSPSEINEWCKAQPQMAVWARWDPDVQGR